MKKLGMLLRVNLVKKKEDLASIALWIN